MGVLESIKTLHFNPKRSGLVFTFGYHRGYTGLRAAPRCWVSHQQVKAQNCLETAICLKNPTKPQRRSQESGWCWGGEDRGCQGSLGVLCFPIPSPLAPGLLRGQMAEPGQMARAASASGASSVPGGAGKGRVPSAACSVSASLDPSTAADPCNQ